MSSTEASSFILEGDNTPSPSHDGDLDSLPSSDTSSSLDSDDSNSDADREWTESLQQLELLLTMVVVPYIGKYFGRKAAYYGWAKFMTWKYPVDITFSKTFKAAGAVEVATAL